MVNELRCSFIDHWLNRNMGERGRQPHERLLLLHKRVGDEITHSFICNRLRDSNLSKKDLNPNSFLINFVDFSVVIFCGNSKHLG